MDVERPEPTAEQVAAERRSTNRWAIGIALALIAVGALCAWRINAKDAPSDLSGDARRVCQEEFIPKRLKAPRTAQYADVTVVGDGVVYTVTGSVDAQNSFGALVRSRFTCVVKSSGDQWVLQSASVS